MIFDNDEDDDDVDVDDDDDDGNDDDLCEYDIAIKEMIILMIKPMLLLCIFRMKCNIRRSASTLVARRISTRAHTHSSNSRRRTGCASSPSINTSPSATSRGWDAPA